MCGRREGDAVRCSEKSVDNSPERYKQVVSGKMVGGEDEKGSVRLWRSSGYI